MEQAFEELKQRCIDCRNCALGQSRTNCVFGVGNPNADLVVVGVVGHMAD